MEKNIRVLIVEDEFINLDLLRDYLEDAGYEVSGDAMKADEAIEILERFDTDIAILDINIKGEKDGIWIATQIRKKYHIPFIFLTAYSDPKTVARAAEVNPYGYLVKPFTQADIFTSIEIALKNCAKEKGTYDLPKETNEETTELAIGDFIFVKDDYIFKKILIADIHFIQAYKNYLEISFANARIVFRSTLQKISEVLPKKHFMQTHRSFIVNINFIDSVNADMIVMGNKEVPLSKTYKEEFSKKMRFFYVISTFQPFRNNSISILYNLSKTLP